MTKSIKVGAVTIKLTELKPIEFITSGVPEIDSLVGGFPRSRITEISGMQGVGKTFLMTKCLAAISKEAKVLYIDCENALNIARLEVLGAASHNIELSVTYIVEEVVELVINSLGRYDVIIVDSVAAMLPRAEEAGEAGEAHVGLKARLMGQFIRKITGKLGKSKTALVFVNQMRETMEIYGLKRSTPGGHALPYAASLRLELSTNRSSRLKAKDGTYTGQTIQVEVTKSKISAPYLKTTFKLPY